MRTKRLFRDKTVVITGAAGGLGRALSRRFGRAGARLGLLDLESDSVESAVRELRADGVDCHGLTCDVTREQDCEDAVATLVERFGGVDVLINNAGITQRSAFAKTTIEVFRRVMNVNLFGTLHCTKAALPSLVNGHGLIIAISSIAGFAPLYGRTGYAASKHALHGLFDSLRTELRNEGVGVMIVCPGFVDTNFAVTALDGDGQLTTHPRSTLGRLSSPESVAESVFRAAERDKRLLVLTRVGRLTRLVTKISPALYEWIMVRSLRSELDR
jgi:NAD(P)-dependent dehydrogenase (short-subunit alcohol dehydrogenase family)